jgi:membrane dipeptidase
MAGDLLSLSNVEETRARKIHEESVIIDGLVPGNDYLNGGAEYLEHLVKGGLAAGSVTAGSSVHKPNFETCVTNLIQHKDIAKRLDFLTCVDSVDDIRRANEKGSVGFILGLQDPRPFGNEYKKLRALLDIGVKIVQLTYNEQNFIGAGCAAREDSGLTYFGIDLIKTLNDHGVVIDLSHCGDTTTMEAIDRSDDPVVFTHSSVRNLCDTPRNKTDAQIKAIADTGGLTAISFFPCFVKRDEETKQLQHATVKDILDHIDHVVELTGVEHVGFGTDMCDYKLDNEYYPDNSVIPHFRAHHPQGIEVFGKPYGDPDKYDPFPQGVDRHTRLLNLTRGLVSRGYTDEEIEKILGGNFLRVFDEVWTNETEAPPGNYLELE